MASFESPRLLSEKELHTTVLGYCSVPDSDHILMTHDSKVVLIQPHNGKLIRSWTCPGSKGHKFTGSAIFSEEDQEFVVIQNKKTLRTIKLQDFNETETFTVKYPIHSIASRPGTSPIVVFEDGSLFFLEDILEDPQTIKPRESIPVKIKAIHCVETATLDDGSLLVLIICTDMGKCYNVLAGIMKANDQNVHYFYTPITEKDQDVASVCSLHSHSIPAFALLSNDQSLMKLSVFVSFRSVNVELANVATIEGDTSNMKIASISQDQVIVLSPGRYIEWFDMTYGSTLEKLDVDSDVEQIFVLNDLILLDSAKSIQRIQFIARPITLAQAMMKSNRSDMLGLPEHVEWTEPLTKTTLFTAEDTRLIRKLIDAKDSDVFISIWNHLWTEDKSNGFKRELCRSEAMKKILSKLGLEDEKKEFWPQAALQQIVVSGFLSGSWCNGLFSQMLDKADWDLLHHSIFHLNEIPERIIVQCITSIFSRETISLPVDSQKEDTKDMEESHCQISEEHLPIIKRILGLRYTEVVMRDELAPMPFQSAQNFILYLTKLLGQLNLLSYKPSLDQVVNWLGLMLDSHISEIIMLEDCWPVIQRLQDAVEVQSVIFENLGVVSKLVERMKCKLPDSGVRSLYTVEIMHLGY